VVTLQSHLQNLVRILDLDYKMHMTQGGTIDIVLFCLEERKEDCYE
jgi:hypothetical protein